MRGLKALDLAQGARRNQHVELTGIPDPQNQGGAASPRSVKAQVAQVGSGGDLALSPPPALGFWGAAALDDGKFAGIALLKPAVIAGPANTTPAAQAVLVSADSVQEFLKANGINASGGSSDAKASVLRVICARK